jgi:hypothetical protein
VTSTARGAISWAGLVLGLGLAAPAEAQAGPDSSSAAYHAIQWYEPLALMGGVTLTAALDEPVADTSATTGLRLVTTLLTRGRKWERWE